METPFPLDRPLEEGVDFTEIPASNPDVLLGYQRRRLRASVWVDDRGDRGVREVRLSGESGERLAEVDAKTKS